MANGRFNSQSLLLLLWCLLLLFYGKITIVNYCRHEWHFSPLMTTLHTTAFNDTLKVKCKTSFKHAHTAIKIRRCYPLQLLDLGLTIRVIVGFSIRKYELSYIEMQAIQSYSKNATLLKHINIWFEGVSFNQFKPLPILLAKKEICITGMHYFGCFSSQ